MPPRVFRSAVSNGPITAQRRPSPLRTTSSTSSTRDDAVADQAVRLAQQRALQTVEHEPLDLAAHQHGSQSGRAVQLDRPLTMASAVDGGRHHLDHGQQVGRVTRVADENARPATAASSPSAIRLATIAELELASGTSAPVRDGGLLQQLSLQLDALRRTLLNEAGIRDRDVEVGREANQQRDVVGAGELPKSRPGGRPRPGGARRRTGRTP